MLANGRVEQHLYTSQVLQENWFGDPHQRTQTVYVPSQYAEQALPVIYLLPAHGKSGQAFLNWKPWEPSFMHQLDTWMGAGTVLPALVVFPDMWTSLGSSQYLNSAMGRYEDHLIQELIPFIDTTYKTTNLRAVIGHSSGGYGAIVQAMRHPEIFHAVACHAADMYWEYTCLPAIAALHQALEKYGGAAHFLAEVSDITPKNGLFWKTVMTMCWSMAHATNAEAPLGFDLPIDETTGALNQAVWERWLTFDPVRMIEHPEHQAALRGMRAVYVAAGAYDEFQAQIGARLFSQKLTHAQIDHRYEEQPIGHSGSDVPYEQSLALLSEALHRETL